MNDDLKFVLHLGYAVFFLKTDHSGACDCADENDSREAVHGHLDPFGCDQVRCDQCKQTAAESGETVDEALHGSSCTGREGFLCPDFVDGLACELVADVVACDHGYDHEDGASAESDSDHGSCLDDNAEIEEFIPVAAACQRSKEDTADQTYDIEDDTAAGCQGLRGVCLDQDEGLELAESICKQVPADVEDQDAEEEGSVLAGFFALEQSSEGDFGFFLHAFCGAIAVAGFMELFEFAGECSPEECDRGECGQKGKDHSCAGSALHTGNDEGHCIGAQDTDLPEDLGGSDQLGRGLFIGGIVGNDCQADGKIRAGGKTGDDQACQQHGEIAGKDTNGCADQVEQVHIVKGADQADGLCDVAGQK